MQIRGLHKSKHFFFYGITYLVPAFALVTIYLQVRQLQVYRASVLENLMHSSWTIVWKASLILLIFTTMNWLLEAFKWRLSVKSLSTISMKEALKHCLVGTASSILTPAKLGDYAAKPAFFKPENRPKAVLLNGLNHCFQMLTTTLFGGISLVILAQKQPLVIDFIDLTLVLIALISLALIMLLLRPFIKSRFHQSIQKYLDFFSVSTKELGVSLLSLSVIRYLVFSFQFILLLALFGNPLDTGLTFIISSSIYIINSMLPTPAASDGIVRGGLGVFLFGLFAVSPWIVLTATLLMWLANHVLPAIVGSVLLMRLQPGSKL